MTTEQERGRPTALDAQKKRDVCRVLELGGTRMMAARFVGCHVRTIHRAATQDIDFARAVVKAETQSQLGHLGAIRTASAKSWRASAWMLERTSPDDFGRRPPYTVTSDEIEQILQEFSREIAAAITDKETRRAVRVRLRQLALRIHRAIKQREHERALRKRRKRNESPLDLGPPPPTSWEDMQRRDAWYGTSIEPDAQATAKDESAAESAVSDPSFAESAGDQAQGVEPECGSGAESDALFAFDAPPTCRPWRADRDESQSSDVADGAVS